ncbi:MAG: Flp family type IVb pilin [Pirellulaceae bacterium]|nr:Flp family type IVb pilin [Pirellulaceae bacterium]
MKNSILRFLKKEDGPIAVEYAVMLALIVIACVGSIALVGTGARDSMQNSADEIGDVLD